MKLYEHEAKLVFADEGITIPKRFGLVDRASAAGKVRLAGMAMAKAQVLVGGRGKAGGIKKVNPESARQAICDILAMDIKGNAVASVLVEEALEYTAAFYLGITVDPATYNNIMIASPAGGVDIEDVAKTQPDKILRIEVPDNPMELPEEIAQKVGRFLDSSRAAELAEVAKKLYRTYQKYDCKLLEINPLLMTAKGPVAADAKMVVDDNAIHRQTALMEKLGITSKRHETAEPTTREKAARAAGFVYVDLLAEDAKREPNKIYAGLVPGGAGYGIFMIDEVTGIGREFGEVVPLNFMDSGGGPTRESVCQMFDLLMDHPLVDIIITSRFGGISSCDSFIKGLIDCLRNRRAEKKRIVPVSGRMVGTDLAAARAYLENARRDTPAALEPLEMLVGNQVIMAEVIRKAIAKHVESKRK